MADPAKILVIDDSEDDRLLYRRSLQKTTGCNYLITESASGEARGQGQSKRTTPAAPDPWPGQNRRGAYEIGRLGNAHGVLLLKGKNRF